MCGDYLAGTPESPQRFDTTPRVRGLLGAISRICLGCRYNPACAGTTDDSTQICISVSIQPRVCGDYGKRAVLAHYTVDTTPRVRGLRYLSKRACSGIRYNPACAGTTDSIVDDVTSSKIQPRVCGDYLTAVHKRSNTGDTTPRVRGLHRI